jgi:non-lysosomal glucosylceramidase
VAASIPGVAWARPIGLGYEPAPRPRVDQPMIDDGPWAGVPIGGIGAGSIGRTQRGDFARHHLRIGEHRFESVAADGFALWASDGGQTRSIVLRTTEPPPGWGPALATGAGTYRALFPRAWFEYDLSGWPVRALEEQLSPVIPGDDASASLPVGAFEWTLTNVGAQPVDVAVLLSWRDDLADVLASPLDTVAPVTTARSIRFDGTAGVVLDRRAGDGGLDGSFALAAGDADGIEVTRATATGPAEGERLWADFSAGGRLRMGTAAKVTGGADRIAAVAARTRLATGETRTLRFAIAWDLPIAEFGGGRRWWKRYTEEWGTGGARAFELAAHGVKQLPVWRAAIERWQAPILDAADRPDWYKAALFNELYFLVDGGTFWPSAPVAGPLAGGYVADLGILECFDYPFYDTLDVHFYAAFALARLWPALQASISRAYASTVGLDDPSEVTIEASGELAPRKIAGALPHDLGGPAEDPLVRVNRYRFQNVNGWKDLNPKFVLQAWRDRTLADDPAAYVRELWPSIRRAMDHVATFDRDGDGLPEHDNRPDQTYDTWPMKGPSAYGGSLWLASLRAAIAFAMEVGDRGQADRWQADFERAVATFGRKLWNGQSFDFDGGGGPTSDSVMADQLVGQWYADVCGLGDLVAPDRVESALRRVFELNVCAFGDGRMGAVNGMRPDGTVDRSSEQSQEVWVGTTYALAAFMIGRGLESEGWTTAEGAARVIWECGLWFRTPEAYDRAGDFRASMYLRPLAIWGIEEALERRRP